MRRKMGITHRRQGRRLDWSDATRVDPSEGNGGHFSDLRTVPSPASPTEKLQRWSLYCLQERPYKTLRMGFYNAKKNSW